MPPGSDKTFLKSVFEIIVLENEGTLICAGHFNMILNPKLDTTNAKRNKTQLSKLVNISLIELGMFDVWRDHSIVYLNIKLEARKKNSLWKLNAGMLNNRDTKEEIKKEIKSCIEENIDSPVDDTILWDTVKAVMRGRLISRAAYQKKIIEEEYKNLINQLRRLEQKHKNHEDAALLHQINIVRRQIDDNLNNEIEKKLRFTKQTYYE